MPSASPAGTAEPDPGVEVPGLRLPGLRLLGRAYRKELFDDPVVVAPRLLGKILVAGVVPGIVAGRIVEVEAYRGQEDAASHAFRGETQRNATMFGRPGHLYVYFTYGMHHCCNVVCWPPGRAGAVLIRALAPIEGLDVMAERRAGATGSHALKATGLCSGPGKLCQALGIDRSFDGVDLLSSASPLRLAEELHSCRVAGPGLADGGGAVRSGPRVGISLKLTSALEPWRWWVAGDAHVSHPSRPPRTPAPGPSRP